MVCGPITRQFIAGVDAHPDFPVPAGRLNRSVGPTRLGFPASHGAKPQTQVSESLSSSIQSTACLFLTSPTAEAQATRTGSEKGQKSGSGLGNGRGGRCIDGIFQCPPIERGSPRPIKRHVGPAVFVVAAASIEADAYEPLIPVRPLASRGLEVVVSALECHCDDPREDTTSLG